MQFTLSTVIAYATFLSGVSAHLEMTEPAMFKNHAQAEGKVLNPLEPSGSDFPCQNGIPDETAPAGNQYEPGSDGVLQITGSATHGGGSGQMVITYDFPPPKDESKWRVLSSYEGNHPINNPAGNFVPGQNNKIPALKFRVHEGLPKGKAIIAWNWFNKVGNREHYMKCATVSIGGSNEVVQGAMDTPALQKLPTMFRANSNGCTVPENVEAIKFKNPGTSVFGSGSYESECDKTTAGSSGNGSGSPPETPETPGQGEGEGDDDEEHPGNNEGGEGEEGAAPPANKPPVVEPPTTTAPPTTTTSATAPIEKPDNSNNGPPANAPAPTAPPSGSCTEGEVVCNSDGSWSQCGSGRLWNMGGSGAGRICKEGKIMLDQNYKYGKRAASVRFSAAHRRRHIHISA